MNVLLVHNFYQQAGGEDGVFADEAALLEKRGHTVGKFTMHNDAVEGMGRVELARKTFWNREAQGPLRQAIRQIGAEIVHFHNTFPLISPASYYTAHAEGAAVVQTLHNYRLLCPAATFYRDGGVCEKCLGRSIPWPAVVHKCYRGNRMASAVIAGMLSFHRFKGTWRDQVDLYIALTEFSRQKFVEGGLPADRIEVKPNFVDPDPGVGRGDGDFAIFVGRLTEEKGVETLLNAWKSLYRNTGVPLRIVGDGPLREVVTREAKNCKGIEYFGRRSGGEVCDMMGQAKALIFPSVWYEGLPKTIVESLAKGTPVIASRLGSMEGLIEEGKTGLLFTAGDANNLIEKGELLLQGLIDRARMRHEARREFESRYTAERNYSILLGCYQRARQRLVGSAARSGPPE